MKRDPSFIIDDATGVMSMACVMCEQVFTLSSGQRHWFAEREMNLPRRCPECRQLRRATREYQPDNR